MADRGSECGERLGSTARSTRETDIELTIRIDTPSAPEVGTNLPFLGHMLEAMAVHAGIGLSIRAEGDIEVDPHHLLEDCGICLGRAVKTALQGGGSITRIGYAVVPMDASLASSALDLVCGRPNLVWRASFPDENFPDGTAPDVYRHLFKGFVDGSGSTLHLCLHYSDDCHHGLESLFKAFGRSLAEASLPLPASRLSSSKGVLDG